MRRFRIIEVYIEQFEKTIHTPNFEMQKHPKISPLFLEGKNQNQNPSTKFQSVMGF